MSTFIDAEDLAEARELVNNAEEHLAASKRFERQVRTQQTAELIEHYHHEGELVINEATCSETGLPTRRQPVANAEDNFASFGLPLEYISENGAIAPRGEASQQQQTGPVANFANFGLPEEYIPDDRKTPQDFSPERQAPQSGPVANNFAPFSLPADQIMEEF